MLNIGFPCIQAKTYGLWSMDYLSIFGIIVLWVMIRFVSYLALSQPAKYSSFIYCMQRERVLHVVWTKTWIHFSIPSFVAKIGIFFRFSCGKCIVQSALHAFTCPSLSFLRWVQDFFWWVLDYFAEEQYATLIREKNWIYHLVHNQGGCLFWAVQFEEPLKRQLNQGLR